MTKRADNTGYDSLLFKPGIKRGKRKNSAPLRDFTLGNANQAESNLTGSFRYDAPGAPLKSTQQLNLDFADFSQHTFFNSAEAKVQKAFTRIINQYPFDGTRSEINAFVDSLTGFEKYVFDSFPTNRGYLAFSGSASPTDPGTFINVKDFKGSAQPTLAKNPTGGGVLDPGTKPFTIEFHFNAPQIANDNQVILQKKSVDNGMTVFLSQTNDTSYADLYMILSSGTVGLSTYISGVEKGEFHHIAATFDRSSGPGGQIKLYKDAKLSASSSFASLGLINFATASMTVGSGSAHSAGTAFSFTPVETLSGALDDLRIWHKAKNQNEIRAQRFEEVFAQKDLQLLMRFNEPSGSFSGNGSNLILDYSGNGLHSSVENFSMSLRNTSSFGSSPVTEASRISTISLFPSYSPITTLNTNLLSSASQYDRNNPNIVTRLIPPHYLRDASQIEGFSDELAGISDTMVTQTDQPGGAALGQPQIIAGLLYTFAENFDELKMFVDEFKRLLKVDVLSTDTVSNQLMPWLSRYYGIELPRLFDSSTPSQYFDGKNVRTDRLKTTALQTVQNALWRRIFSDLPFLFSTRGTHTSLRSILINLGISPDGPIRIREFGGSQVRTLGDSFVRRHEIAAMLDMSGTLASAGTLNAQGIDDSRPFIQGSYLSGSRVEPGLPLPAGTIGEVGSDNANDGLFTSGSWSFEGRYKFEGALNHPAAQSLARLHATGTDASASSQSVLFNCVALKPSLLNSSTGSIVLYGRPNESASAALYQLVLTGVDVFDGGKWQVTFGRDRNDLIESYVSSSYFLRASKMGPGGLEQYHFTSSYYDDGSSGNTLQNISANYNASGTFAVIGSQSLDVSGGRFINDSALVDQAKMTTFTGKVSSLKFFSKGLSVDETKTHARNFKSLGVLDPEVNFNFVTNASGSFARLRQDVSFDQPVTESSALGALSGFDFSQNYLTYAGTGFEASKRVVKPERFDFEVLSSNFQSGENPNKVRVRSFQNANDVEVYGVSFAPLHDIPQNDQPNDSKRVAIEISTTQGLNEDIMNIFSTLDALDNIIGSPELVFSQDYPHMRNLRRIYFNRLTEKVNFLSFFEFFKFFDDTVGDLLEQMMPSDVKFNGSSYVIESHALERPKFTYKYYDMYLGEEDRGGKEVILLQQIVGTLRKI
jgi:hypothetical protein